MAQGVQVLHKAIDVLEQMKSAPAGVSLGDLASAAQLPKATAYRILATFERRGYIDRAHNGDYRLTRKLFQRQTIDSVEEHVRDVAVPAMQQLAASSRETVNLGVLDGGEVVVIATIESPQAVRMSSKVGNRRLLHCTALGKVLLTGLDEREAMRLVRAKRMHRMTPHTITAEGELLHELRIVREQGFAMDNQEQEMDGRCIGAPILDRDGRVLAALSISGPVHRMTEARVRILRQQLLRTCRAISQAI
jgi:DNA-binding IclR family transcriptional regulator